MEVRKAWLLACILMCGPSSAAQDCVVLLHGLARSQASMIPMGKALTQEGYRVVNHDYPSRHHDIQTLASREIPLALDKCPEEGRIHFVTHSLGGILLRHYLTTHTLSRLGRTVMLGPPNQGSQVVDKLKHVPGFQLFNGPAGMQLGTDSTSVPRILDTAYFEVGIIAGNKSINWILSTMLPNPDDGKVSVENTKLKGMADHIVLPVSHPFLMKNKTVIRQVIHFLDQGRFSRPPDHF
jgi:pimeloyl-ACP methyl ester carboxylesterase